MHHPVAPAEHRVRFAPPGIIDHKTAVWPGLRAEIVSATQRAPFDYRFKAPYHLLIAAERAERDDGETSLEGLPKSTLRSFSGKLTFVPAGHEFYGWQQPRLLTRVNFFYIDPRGPLLEEELRFADVDFQPRLFFDDPVLWKIALRLKAEAETGARLPRYGDALGILLGHELVRLNSTPSRGYALGGLSGWQQKKVADFIEDHLADTLSLRALAGLVELSPFHFARAFKQSFGVPPHRYHVSRRMERAKALLGERSVTEVALAVGFAETSSFSAAFRKAAGCSPSEYRRGLS